MASVLSIRRPIAALAARTAKQTTQKVTPLAAVTTLLSSPARPRSYSTAPRPQRARLALASSNIKQCLSHRQQTIRRINHYTTKPPRSWKFEDVCPVLPYLNNRLNANDDFYRSTPPSHPTLPDPHHPQQARRRNSSLLTSASRPNSPPPASSPPP